MRPLSKYWSLSVIAVLLLGTVWGYQSFFSDHLKSPQYYQSNGAVQITNTHISSKYPGRVQEIFVNEGDLVKKGDLLVAMQVDDLKAQLAEANALYDQAVSGVDSAHAQLAARKSEKFAAEAFVRQQKNEFHAAQIRLDRVRRIAQKGALSLQDLDDQIAFVNSLESAVASAEAQVITTQAAIDIAETNITSSETRVKAAEASILRIKAEINDANLVAPVDGRIQYRVANPGEVVSAGGIVLSMIDLNDIYMSFFIPEHLHTLVDIGDEVRIVLDAMPEQIIRARLYFISPSAQFTPKYVETQSEREKMMFRVKARFDDGFIKEYKSVLKVGVRGTAWVNTYDEETWPTFLTIDKTTL